MSDLFKILLKILAKEWNFCIVYTARKSVNSIKMIFKDKNQFQIFKFSLKTPQIIFLLYFIKLYEIRQVIREHENIIRQVRSQRASINKNIQMLKVPLKSLCSVTSFYFQMRNLNFGIKYLLKLKSLRIVISKFRVSNQF